MLIKNIEVVIPKDEPFKNDALGREQYGELLTEFVSSVGESMVICLNAPWGEGKTTFLKMWAQQLKNNNVPTLVFNAWENDFTDEPLISLIGEISSSIKELSQKGDESKAREYFEKAKGLAVKLSKKSLPAVTKIVTAGALDLDKVTEQALAALAENIAKEELNKYENSKKTIKGFRELLSSFASSITEDESSAPLVFIIDELDRCRPDYTISLLEKIKHLFNVDNIIFILGADKVQISHSIKTIYGLGMDSENYLKRFIDITYELPKPEKGKFVEYLFERMGFNSYFNQKQGRLIQYEGKQTLSAMKRLFEIYNSTLREQEHSCTLLSLCIRTTPTDHKLFPLLLAFLIVQKVHNPDFYKRILSAKMSGLEILNEFKEHPGSIEYLDENFGVALEAYLLTCIPSDKQSAEAIEEYTLIEKADSGNKADIDYRVELIRENLKEIRWEHEIGILPYLVRKIELVSNFST